MWLPQLGKRREGKMSKMGWILSVLMLLIFFPCSDTNAAVYSSISGRVIAEDTGAGLPGATVAAFLVGGGHEGHHYASTDAGGVYAVEDLEAGTYGIVFFKQNGFYVNEQPHLEVVLPQGKHLVNVNHLLALGGSVSGRVYQPDGTTPVAGVGVYASVSGIGSIWTESSKYGATGDDGAFLLEGLPQSDSCSVEVMIPGHAILKRTVKVTKGAVTRDVNFIVTAGDVTGVSGHVGSSPDGAPVKNAKVDLADGSGNDVGTARTDDSGNYSIIGVLPGIYKLTVFWPEGSIWLEKKDITVEPGKSATVNFEFTMPAPAAMIFETSIQMFPEKCVSSTSVNASVQGSPSGGAGYPGLKFEWCFDNQEEPVNAAYMKLQRIVDASSCISRGTRPMMQERLRKGIVIECVYQKAPCNDKRVYGESQPGGNRIRLCPKAFVPELGCLESTLLHELTHMIGHKGENVPYECEGNCFPGCSNVPPDYPGIGCGC
jgi:hypothetical protein